MRRKVWNVVLGIVAVVIFGIAGVRLFVLQEAQLRDHGMQPQLGNGDTVLVDRTANEYAVGDLVVFYRADFPFVRRVVGVPGDKVGVEGGFVTVNGFPAETEPRDDHTYKDATVIEPAEGKRPGERVCKRHLESHSLTFYEVCMSDGPDERKPDVDEQYVRAGHYYVMCDNRFHCAADSREMGPIPKGAIRGRVPYRMRKATQLDPSLSERIFGRWEELR